MKTAIDIINEELKLIRPSNYESMIICRTLNQIKSKIENAQQQVKVEPEVINTTPRICEPVLAEISKSGELGKEGWYEVVYHDGERWQHFAGSDTFDDGERVVKWKYCKECL